MKATITKARRYHFSEIKGLDPVTVICENFEPGRGKIIIECYGKAWSSYWGSMGENSLEEFFCSCDEHYIAKNLSDIDATVYSIDKIREEAEEKGVDVSRDDPWNDYDFLSDMYGPDPMEWSDSIPTEPNRHYEYLCKIIKAVQEGFNSFR